VAERFSLADQAVSVLAAVQRMDAAITNEHEERHHVRWLKRLAEQTLDTAFRQAQELAFLADQIHRDAQDARESSNA
jgi:hypothetical protein